MFEYAREVLASRKFTLDKMEYDYQSIESEQHSIELQQAIKVLEEAGSNE